MEKDLISNDSLFSSLSEATDFEDFFNRFLNFKDQNSKPSFNVDISEDENSYHVDADLPGVQKEDINVELKENHLIISAERKQEEEEEKRNYYTIEKSYGKFYRAIPLPSDVDPENITAKLDDGVLKLSVAKSKKDKESTKKIEIE